MLRPPGTVSIWQHHPVAALRILSLVRCKCFSYSAPVLFRYRYSTFALVRRRTRGTEPRARSTIPFSILSTFPFFPGFRLRITDTRPRSRSLDEPLGVLEVYATLEQHAASLSDVLYQMCRIVAHPTIMPVYLLCEPSICLQMTYGFMIRSEP